MDTINDLCFLCTNDDNNCTPVDEKIVTQVEYLIPEITIIKLGIPLRICSICNAAINGFSKFKQTGIESSRRLEARIKGAQGPPLHTGSPPVMNDNETSGAKSEKMEEIFIQEKYVEETRLDTNRAYLNPIGLSEPISAEPHNQLHEDRMSQNIQLHTGTNADNAEEIVIKEEQIEETPQTKELYNNILKEECVSNSVNDDTDRQPEHNTEDESATLNTSKEVWEGSSSDTKKSIHKTENHTERNENESNARIKIKDLWTCCVCNKKFKYKQVLTRHMKIHSAVREFKCFICSKEFTYKHHLADHIKSHSKVKEFQCHICEKSFTQKATLTRHMIIHSRIINFQCNVCTKKFKHKRNLVTHMKIHSSI